MYERQRTAVTILFVKVKYKKRKKGITKSLYQLHIRVSVLWNSSRSGNNVRCTLQPVAYIGYIIFVHRVDLHRLECVAETNLKSLYSELVLVYCRLCYVMQRK